MRIKSVLPQENWRLMIITEEGTEGMFDVTPYLEYEAFQELKDPAEFMLIKNGGYYVEWSCGADLSADTIDAKMIKS